MITLLLLLIFGLAVGLVVSIARSHRVRVAPSLMLFVLVLAGVHCAYRLANRFDQRVREERNRLALLPETPIEVAVAWPTTELRCFVDGVNLAVKRINAAGGVTFSNAAAGRPVRRALHIVNFKEPDGDVAGAVRVARKIASEPRFMAVIGHASSDTAIPASIVYEEAELLYLSPVATNPQLTQHQFENLVSLVPSDIHFGEHIARAMADAGLTNVVVLYDIGFYGTGLMTCFEEFAGQAGLTIVTKQSFNRAWRDFRPVIAELRGKRFDAVMLAASGANAGRMIRHLREMSVTHPIYGGDGLDVADVLSTAGQAPANLFVSTVYSTEYIEKNGTAMGKDFLERFRAAYKTDPDYMAMQGYEAVMLLVEAFQRANTIHPVEVSAIFKFSPEPWEGVMGRYLFRSTGEVVGKNFFINDIQKGKTVMRSESGGIQP